MLQSLGKAFRHGDIENILENLAKHVGGPVGGAGLLGFATSVFKAATGGSKFNKMDVKRVYFVSSCCMSFYLPLTNSLRTGQLAPRLFSGIWARSLNRFETNAILKAMDIAGLTKLSAETINLIIAVLGFMVTNPTPPYWFLNLTVD